MSIPTSEGWRSRPVLVWTMGLWLVFLAAVLCACADDVGQCCTTSDPADRGRIPTATVSAQGRPSSDIAIDPAFDCDSLVCVAYRGSRAFCTKRCFADDDCRDGFVCRSVLEADPGPGATIRPGDRFCVRDAHVCSE